MSFITKNAWLSINTREPVSLDIPELGGSVLIKPLSTAETQSIPRAVNDDHWPANRETLRLSLVDEDGKTPLFTSDEIDTLKANHAANVLMRIQRKISDINGWTANPEADAKT